MAMGFLKPGTQLLPVQGELSGLDDGWLAQRGLGIDGEIPVMGMLLAEIIAGQDLRFPLGENLLQLSDDVFQFLPAKVFAEPQDESCYFLQGGGSPWNFVPFDWSQSVATSPPFAFPVKPKAWLPVLPQLWKPPRRGKLGKIPKRFSQAFHRTWKTLRPQHCEFPTVSTVAATSRLISFALQRADAQHDKTTSAQPGDNGNGTLEGEKLSVPDSYRKHNKLAA